MSTGACLHQYEWPKRTVGNSSSAISQELNMMEKRDRSDETVR